MNRRRVLQQAAALPLLASVWRGMSSPAAAQTGRAQEPFRRARPGEPTWPSPASWEKLRLEVGDALLEVKSPLAMCQQQPGSAACANVLETLKNPYAIADDAALTQTFGWLGAWSGAPSAYAVAADKTQDVVAAVNFARDHRLRLVVKGAGHSYQGTSNAPDSLLIWTRRMNAITVHEAFVAQNCEGREPPQPAVSVGAGAMWGAVYDAVTTRAGRYVQGGGCLSVGVAGLVQSGGFGSFSKNYGLVAAGLLEAEIVTADGVVRIVNACSEPDLFWALKGGGGGSLGVVSKLTLRTRELPEFFGGVFGRIKASSDAAFRSLIARTLQFYRQSLFNRHWGEQIIFEKDNAITFSMLFQGLDQRQAESLWRPFLAALTGPGQDVSIDRPVSIVALPARGLWDYQYFKTSLPHMIVVDDRPGVPASNVSWAGDIGQAGHFLHAYRSAWLPATLLQDDRRQALAEALYAASRSWQVSLHFNKGLAGAPAEDVDAARNTAMNPAVLDAFALAIIAGGGRPTLPGMPGHQVALTSAAERAAAIGRAIDALLTIAPNAGSYVSESDYFEPNWQQAFWGANYPRLAAVKTAYDPDGLFFVHHGVGSEYWSGDGFTRVLERH